MMNVIIKLLTPTLTLPQKWGGKMRDVEISISSTSRARLVKRLKSITSQYIPSPSRGRARVGVQYPQSANALKMLTVLLMALLMATPFTSVQAAPDDDFGRLFSRQNERKNLDIKRQNQKLKVITPQDLQPEPVADAAPPELPNPITMQGYVKRSDGASTLWINNQAVQEGSAIDNVQIGRLKGQQNKTGTGSDSLNVKIPANGRQVQLKAGQVYMPETNQIVELKTVEKAKRLNLEETGAIGDEKSLQ